MSNGFLHRYFLNNPGKIIHKWTNYFDAYERHFERYRGKSPTFIEVGVFKGGSLQMWREYFGEGCKIIGLDINPACMEHAGKDIDVYIGSQDDPAVFAKIMETYPHIDMFLDDGSHLMHHMIKTFEIMYHKISPTGVYMVEDTHACYAPRFGGAIKKEGTFLEYVKDRIDELHAFHAECGLPISQFTRSTDSISIYDGMVAFEKSPQGRRISTATGVMGDVDEPRPASSISPTP